MRNAAALIIVISLALAMAGVLVVAAQERRSHPVSAQTANDETARQLAAQKLKLLEQYLAAPHIRRIERHPDPKPRAALQEARSALAEARRLVAEGDATRAEAALDRGLKILSAASAVIARGAAARSATQERAQYEASHHRIRSFLDSLRSATGHRTDAGDQTAALSRVNALLGNAAEFAAAGRYLDANKLLAEAYQITVTVVAAVRHGETTVSRLRFDTPMDEFEYERRRNLSYEMLISIMLREKKERGSGLLSFADHEVAASRALRATADALAHNGDAPTAIRTLEEATRHLVKVLRAGGLPVSE
jgi:hypothetical protein